MKRHVTVFLLAVFSTGVSAAPPDIPSLAWQERSDWINVQTDVTPAAVGDGQADDTAAIQAALDIGGDEDGLPAAGHVSDHQDAGLQRAGGRLPGRRARPRHAAGLGRRRRAAACSGATASPTAATWG